MITECISISGSLKIRRGHTEVDYNQAGGNVRLMNMFIILIMVTQFHRYIPKVISNLPSCAYCAC